MTQSSKWEYSADSGRTWQSAGKAEISSSAYTEFTFPVNVKGDNLIRLRRTSGERVNIDNFTVTDYAGQSAIEIVDDIRHGKPTRSAAHSSSRTTAKPPASSSTISKA